MILGMTPHGEHETVSQLPLGAKVCSTSSQSTGDRGCLEDFMIVAAKKKTSCREVVSLMIIFTYLQVFEAFPDRELVSIEQRKITYYLTLW